MNGMYSMYNYTGTTGGATSFFDRRGLVGDTNASSGSLGSRTSSVAGETDHDLLSFLAMVQVNEVDILPTTWQPDLGRVGAGGTANIQQSLFDKKLSYVFKRIYRGVDEQYAYKALVSEISILGHDDIRGHPNIVKLAGISWDVISSLEPIWPSLVFQKSDHGDLRQFMKSEAGASIDFKARMKLFDDIAVGIAALHEIDVVHGDIKPMNVLIFERESEENDSSAVKYIAKIGDFGYSSLHEKQVNKETEDGIRVPISKPWNAPEVTEFSSTFPLQEAKLTDVYSLSLVGLWLLFNDRLLELGVDVGRPVADPEWKCEERLQEITSTVVDKQDGLESHEVDSIKEFFKLTLAENPAVRSVDWKELIKKFTTLAPAQFENGGYSDYDRWVIYQQHASLIVPDVNHKNFDPSVVREAYEGHRAAFQNPYNYWNPYHPVNIYTSPLSRGYYTNPDLYPDITKTKGSHFLIYRSFRQLVYGDYRIWKHIFETLKRRTSDERVQQSDRLKAAYQLAFCYEMGFGTTPDAEQVTFYLTKSGKSRGSLNHEIGLIREDKQADMFMFKKLDGKIEFIQHVDHYLATEKLEDVQAAYSPIAHAANAHFGEDHPISIQLNKILASCFRAAGDLDKAEELYNRLASICEEFYGPRAPNRLDILESLADCSRKRGDIAGVESGQEQVAATYLANRVAAEHKADALDKLATIQMEKGSWAEAAELQFDVVKLKEERFGEAHKETVAALLKLMGCLKSQRLLRPAEIVALDALTKAEERALGEQEKDIIEAHACLSSIYENIKTGHRRLKPFKVSIMDAYGLGYPWLLAVKGSQENSGT
ncbi:hypothetical protein TWF106_011199 [Orbilia oligospora]|uniref:Protein kinase domain-containing protein n=1 Tax=Orbilia oligospora TaxID=2813651 RepID=A0A6G1MI28_ORBOL|nr:hypothetical protein TWF679_008654 [Orbilia oligospora]KAF3226787.1 hypothetical protein TWF106_011199 [Orbilia oligospora]KAF3229507.1 hypothetical protein TWF191_001229 [Orbilia oligospora]KAF3258348.1 hypothetical protein TWF192_000479 [Orbilia oligospora]